MTLNLGGEIETRTPRGNPNGFAPVKMALNLGYEIETQWVLGRAKARYGKNGLESRLRD